MKNGKGMNSMRYGWNVCRAATLAAGVLVSALSARASMGPPVMHPAYHSEIAVEVGTGSRDLDLDGMVGTAQIRPARLESTLTRYEGRFLFALSENVSVYGLLGASRINLGNLSLQAQGISQGVLAMKGDYGVLWGAGGDFTLGARDAWADLTMGASAQYRRFSSDILGGDVDVNEFRLALKGGRRFDKATIYAGALYSTLWGRYNGTTSLGFAANGAIESHDDFGAALGVDYAFTERIAGRVEAELISSTAINAGIVYTFGGPWLRRAPEAEAPPPSPPVPPAAPAGREREAARTTAPREAGAAPVAERPQASEENIRTANELVELGRYDEAIVFYRRATAMDPRNFRAVYNLATAQYLARDYEGARRSYEEALRIELRDVESHLYLGFCHYRMGRADAAARSWRRVLELDPENAVALNNLQALGL